jgi:hypothetical protein
MSITEQKVSAVCITDLLSRLLSCRAVLAQAKIPFARVRSYGALVTGGKNTGLSRCSGKDTHYGKGLVETGRHRSEKL